MSKIDDIFRDGLSDKGLKYSKSDWKAMAALLDHKASFFFRYRWWIRSSIFIAVLGVSSFVCFYDFDNDRQDIVVTSNQEVNRSQSITQEPSIDFEDKHINENLVEIKPSSPQESTQKLEIKEEDMAVVIPEKKQNDFVSSTDYNRDDYNLNNPKISGEINVNPAESTPDIIQTDISNSESNEMNFNTNNLANEILNQKDIIEDIDQTSEQKLNSSIVLENLKQETLGLDPYGIDGFKYDHNPNIKNIGVLKSPYSRWSFYVSPYLGMIQYKTVIKLNGLIDENNHKTNENELQSMGYGMNISAQKNRWKFTTGFGMISLQQKTNYNITTTEKTYIYKKKLLNRNYTISPRGKPIALIGDVIVDSTFSTSQQDVCPDCIAKFDYWSVPLQLNYQTITRGRVSYFGGLGLNFDILKKAKGLYTASANDGILDVVDLDEKLVAKRLIRINGSIGVRYGLAKSWGLWSSYSYGYGMKSMLNSYDQIPKTNTIQFGVEYKIR